jgi:oligopeptide transport system ATP-binding protein
VSEPLLQVDNLGVSYPLKRQSGMPRALLAVQAVSFELRRGQTLGIVGESGSGKSSIARALLRLIGASNGSVRFDGCNLFELTGAALRAARARIQVVFQHPLASLDPRMHVGEIIAEPLREFAAGLSALTRRERVLSLMQRVGLTAGQYDAYPHELSGGQAQRVGIARALISEPALLVCDEPLSALDVSVKAQISNLLKDLQQQTTLAILLVSHDLAAVRYLCDHVLVLYLGRVMEIAPRDALFASPRHPYTRALLQAVPTIAVGAARAMPLSGEIPSPLTPPSGCVFRTRCPSAVARCAVEQPALRLLQGSHVACHRAEELLTRPV